MAKLPSKDDAIRVVLDTAAHYNLRPTYALSQKMLLSHIMVPGKLTGEEVADAVEAMVERGYLKENEHGALALTDEGFAAI